MNREQMNGAVKEVLGKAQWELGKMLGSQSLQVHGLMTQANGKFEKMIGGLKLTMAFVAK